MRVQIGDIRLFFDVDGVGLVPDGASMRERPTIILLHGGPGFDHSVFKPEFGAFRDIGQVVYYDHRGQGRSDRSTPERWNLPQWADDLVALCDVLGIEKPIVWGVSFGGFVALQYAARHPGHASKVIADSTAARLDLGRMLPVFERLGGPEARRVAEAFWADPTDENMAHYLQSCMPLYNRRADPDAEARMARTMETANFDLFRHFLFGEQRTYDLRADLPSVASPLLLLAGHDDPVTPMAAAEEVAACVPAHLLRFERFDDCGHGVTRDQPERAGRVIREFIRG